MKEKVLFLFGFAAIFFTMATLSTATPLPPPSVPVLLAPADAAASQPLTVNFVWNAVAGATDYHFQAATDNLFTTLVTDVYLADTTLIQPGLSNNQTYYWRVLARDLTDSSAYSTPFSFSTRLATPLLLDPMNNANTVSRNANFIWGNVPGATEHRFQLSTNAGFSSFVYDTLLTAGSTLTADLLPFNTVYYWRVYAKNAVDSSLFTAPFTFITIMDTPVLNSPADGAQNVNVSVQLKWNSVPGADYYTYRLADDVLMSNIVATGSPADTHVTVSGLTHWKQYYWQVTPYSNHPNTGVGSAQFTFKTRLAPPSLHSPAAGADGISIQPILKWRSVNGAATYELQLSNSNTFATLLIDSTGLTDTTFNVYPFVLANGTDYYWRIRAVNAVSQSFYSTRVFTTVAEIYPYLAHPINGDLVYSLTPTLFWYINVAPGAVQYDVMYSVDSTFPNALTVIADAGPEINYTIPAPLLPDTKYYWKVRSKYLPDVIVKYSVRDSFVTYGADVPPTGDWPKDSAEVYTYTPELTWSMSMPYPSYTYEYRYKANAAPDWQDTVAVGAALKDTLPVLIPGAYYSWQVRSFNGNVSSPWSPTYEFMISTNLAASAVVPVPVYPAGGVTVYSTAPVFNWSVAGTSQGLTFELEVRTDSLFTGTATDVGLTGLYYQKVGLLSGTTYYWKIRSKLHGAYSSWSGFESFATSAAGPIADPVLIYPVDSISVYVSTPYLLWYSPAHSLTTTYDVEYRAADTNFSMGSTLVTGLPLGVYQTPNLDPATTYYWRARAHNGILSTAWTEPEAFYVVDPQGSLVPQIIYPTGGVVTADSMVQVLWYVNHGHQLGYTYDIEFSLTNSFTGVPSVAGIDFNVYDFEGAPATQYYFRIRTNNGAFTSAWSAAETFTTPAALRPARPTIGSPANNMKVFSTNPVVSWYVPAAPSAILKYDVEYSDKADFSNAVKISGVQKKSAALSNMQTGKTYYWRVRGKNNDGVYSQYSGSGVFRVESPTAVTGEVELPGVFALEQNYPNPFNPATTIKYSVAEKSAVRLSVFDMLGREIAVLVNGEQIAGSYSLEFNAAKLASGVYFYKLQSGTSALTRKFVLLK